MVLYNLTIAVEPLQTPEWLDYMRGVHIPQIMNTGCFIHFKICRIPSRNGEENTFAVQYVAPSPAHFERYEQEFAAELRKDYANRFGQSTGIFRTLLEILDEGNAPMRDL